MTITFPVGPICQGIKECTCGFCGKVEYSTRLSFRPPGPLDEVGTEAYFTAVMAAARRKAEARSGFKPAPIPRAVKVKTELLDHVGSWKSDENRMKDVVFGHRATAKANALNKALVYAKV